MKMFNFVIPSIVFTLSITATTVQAALPNYLIKSDLGAFSPVDMNNSDQVVGNYPTVIVTNGVTIPINGAGFTRAINDSGQVVGTSSAFLYQNGVVSSLGWNSTAYGINNSGVIAGSAAFNLGPNYQLSEAALYQNGAWQNLDPTFSNFGSLALAINNNGVAVGWVSHNPGDTIAGIFSNGNIQTIGASSGNVSEATSINDKGLIVGWSLVSGPGPGIQGPSHAFIYDNGVMQDLGGAGGGNDYNSHASDINNLGLVVGDYNNHAFLYSQTDGLVDLNSLLANNQSGITLSNAVAINDQGDILAQGTDGHAYILVNAVPIPATAWLFGSGLMGLAGAARKRKSV